MHFKGLENNLQRKLRVVRFTRTDAGRAVGDADGAGGDAEVRTVSEIVERLRQVEVVEDVEHFHAELGVNALFVDGNVLEQGEIDVLKARPVDRVAVQVAIGAVSRNREAVGVEVLGKGVGLHRAVAVDGRSRDVGAVLILSRAAVVRTRNHIDGLAALELEHAVDLPAAGESLRSDSESGNRVVQIRSEVVADVQAGIPLVPVQIEGVLWRGVEAAGDVDVVAPRVGKLGGQPMPLAALQCDL